MKRRAFRLRFLIDKVKSKKARQKVIQEYVTLIAQISQTNWVKLVLSAKKGSYYVMPFVSIVFIN